MTPDEKGVLDIVRVATRWKAIPVQRRRLLEAAAWLVLVLAVLQRPSDWDRAVEAQRFDTELGAWTVLTADRSAVGYRNLPERLSPEELSFDRESGCVGVGDHVVVWPSGSRVEVVDQRLSLVLPDGRVLGDGVEVVFQGMGADAPAAARECFSLLEWLSGARVAVEVMPEAVEVANPG